MRYEYKYEIRYDRGFSATSSLHKVATNCKAIEFTNTGPDAVNLNLTGSDALTLAPGDTFGFDCNDPRGIIRQDITLGCDLGTAEVLIKRCYVTETQ